ncbi:hypothetical protein GALMADRAFT_229777 [Galerina marginata CBS 339.88]|uniref:Uncharacterized protein n=1 Tax=Galerina marginata (strain CBS 339.88) TaxID=685588 RepID=A0A067SWJ0_GALM3|nr:hypothetical protein GALMADRAFT_229777 [Galerina marginata CBS 339.88]
MGKVSSTSSQCSLFHGHSSFKHSPSSRPRLTYASIFNIQYSIFGTTPGRLSFSYSVSSSHQAAYIPQLSLVICLLRRSLFVIAMFVYLHPVRSSGDCGRRALVQLKGELCVGEATKLSRPSRLVCLFAMFTTHAVEYEDVGVVHEERTK